MTMQPTERNFEQDYRLKGTLVFTFALLLLFIRIISSALLSQIGQPPVVFSFWETETVYKLFQSSGIINVLTSNFIIAALFDALLFFFTRSLPYKPQEGICMGFLAGIGYIFFTV